MQALEVEISIQTLDFNIFKAIRRLTDFARDHPTNLLQLAC
jgi:hypothetical protein